MLLWPSHGFAGNDPQDIAKDFCHAVAAQALCGKYFTMDRTVEGRMEQLAGGKLRGKASPLNAACETGYSEYYNAEGANGQDKACTAALVLFGPQGSRRPGLVAPRPQPAAMPAPPKAQPVRTPQVKTAPAAAPQNALLILTQLPALPAGATPESILGGAPGFPDPQTCQQIIGKIASSGKNLSAAKTFAEQTIKAIIYVADVKAAQALCPSMRPSKLPDAVLTGAINTGLDACPVVFETVKKLNKVSSEYRKRKLYRGIFGVNEAKLWALERLNGNCSKNTAFIMKSTLKYARSSAQRDQKTYTCRLWQDRFYEEMKKARALGTAKRILEAIKHLDTRAAAAIHGQIKACENPSYSQNSKKQWLSSRKYLQVRLGG